jgi:hypothetical protein
MEMEFVTYDCSDFEDAEKLKPPGSRVGLLTTHARRDTGRGSSCWLHGSGARNSPATVRRSTGCSESDTCLSHVPVHQLLAEIGLQIGLKIISFLQAMARCRGA